VHPEQANKRFNRWVRHLNEECFGKHYRNKGQGVSWTRGTEMQNREVIHYHALMGGGIGDARRLSYVDLWHDEIGFGTARVYKYEPTRGARRYVAKCLKYLSKGGEIDVFVPPRVMSQMTVAAASLPYSYPER
jgi:hypothetical protein